MTCSLSWGERHSVRGSFSGSSPGSGNPTTLTPATILIAEPHDDTRAMLRVYLENCGLRIVEASTGPEALELAKAEGRPDLVVIEMWLPEVDGYEVCRRLRAEEPTRAIPIIAVTSDAWPSALAKASSVGCNAVLAKPSPFEDLHRELFRLLGVPSSESSPILPSEAFPPTRDAVRKRSEREPKNLER